MICKNLVDTNRRLINTSPSLVSSIMQYFGSSRPDSNNGRRSTSYSDSPADTAIQNFAVLGQPCDVTVFMYSLYSVHSQYFSIGLLFCSYYGLGKNFIAGCFRVGCPSCCLTQSVCIDGNSNHQPRKSHYTSSYTSQLLGEDMLHPFCWLSIGSISIHCNDCTVYAYSNLN